MTPQQIFDTVVNHLRQQGCKSEDEDRICLYRGPNGTKCAAGILIRDDEYDHRLEVNAFHSVVDNHLEDASYQVATSLIARLKPHRNLIVALQKVHDMCEVEVWESRFSAIAEVYSLIYTEPKS
jgi:hypothetical protein